MRILTGSTGKNHVTAADDGALHAGLAGKGSYVLNIGQKFKATVKSATSIQLADGDGVLNGRHFRTELGSSDTVTIAENSAGTNRNDIIGVKYSMSSGVESMAWQVIKGTATTGTATDPAYSKGDLLAGGNSAFMPMYRVKLSGASISAVEALYTVLPTISDLGDRTSPLDIAHGGTGSTTAANARTALGITPANIGAATDGHTHALTSDKLTGTLPVAKGGTGSTTAADARTALGITPANIGALAAEDYDGLYIKSGAVVSAEAKEGRGISVLAKLEPKHAGSGEPSLYNVRPISGWTGAKLTRCGKNLLKNTATTKTVNGVTFTVNADGTVTANGTATANAYYVVGKAALPVGSYIVSGSPSGGSNAKYFMYADYSGGTNDYGSGGAFTLTETKEVVPTIVIRSGVTALNLVFKPMIRLASIDDATYEPHQGNTYTADFGQTVYGGTLDWNAGVLTVDRAMLTLTGTEKYTYVSGWQAGCYVIYGSSLPGAVKIPNHSTVAELICSHTTAKTTGQLTSTEGIVGVGQNADNLYLSLGTQDKDSLVNYITAQYAAGTPVQVAYRLAEPTTIQLTPVQIAALDGVNTLYGDYGELEVAFNHDDLNHLAGTLQVAHGGTGATTAADARTALGITPANIGAAITLHKHDLNELTITGTLPVAKGGTGSTTVADARTALGITPANIGAAAQSSFWYMSTEVETAERWFGNRKPIYRRVWSLGAFAKNKVITLDLTSSLADSIDTVVSLRGMAVLEDPQYVVPLPYANRELTHVYGVQLSGMGTSNPKIEVTTGSDSASGFTSGFIVMEYTKK